MGLTASGGEEGQDSPFSGLNAVALYAYAAVKDDELSVHVGQRVQLSQMYNDGWCLVQDESGQLGMVPSNYLSYPTIDSSTNESVQNQMDQLELFPGASDVPASAHGESKTGSMNTTYDRIPDPTMLFVAPWNSSIGQRDLPQVKVSSKPDTLLDMQHGSSQVGCYPAEPVASGGKQHVQRPCMPLETGQIHDRMKLIEGNAREQKQVSEQIVRRLSQKAAILCRQQEGQGCETCGEMSHFAIEFSENFLGMQIQKDADDPSAMEVIALSPQSPSGRSGKIKIGDRMKSINGKTIRGCDEAAVRDLIMSASRPVIITFERSKRRSAPAQIGRAGQLESTSDFHETKNKAFENPDGGGMGSIGGIVFNVSKIPVDDLPHSPAVQAELPSLLAQPWTPESGTSPLTSSHVASRLLFTADSSVGSTATVFESNPPPFSVSLSSGLFSDASCEDEKKVMGYQDTGGTTWDGKGGGSMQTPYGNRSRLLGAEQEVRNTPTSLSSGGIATSIDTLSPTALRILAPRQNELGNKIARGRVQLCQDMKPTEMYGIGLDLVIEQTGMKVKKVVDLRDAQSQSINGLVKEGDVVLAVNGVGLRGLDGTSVIENLIWGPQNTGVVLTLRCHSTHTQYEVIAVRHLLKGVKQKPEVALAVAADLHGRQLTASFSLIHTLNALRRCVVDPEGKLLDVYSSELPWDDVARQARVVKKETKRKWKQVIQQEDSGAETKTDMERVDRDSSVKHSPGENMICSPIYWNMGLAFQRSNNAIRPNQLNSEPAIVKLVVTGGPGNFSNIMEGDIVVAVDGRAATAQNILWILSNSTSENDLDDDHDCSDHDDYIADLKGEECVGVPSILTIERGKDFLEIEVVRTAAANVRHLCHVLHLVNSLDSEIEEAFRDRVAEGSSDGHQRTMYTRVTAEATRRAILNRERERQQKEHLHAMHLRLIHTNIVNLVDSAAESLHVVSTPPVELTEECKQLRQRVVLLETIQKRQESEMKERNRVHEEDMKKISAVQHDLTFRMAFFLQRELARRNRVLKTRKMLAVWEGWHARVVDRKRLKRCNAKRSATFQGLVIKTWQIYVYRQKCEDLERSQVVAQSMRDTLMKSFLDWSDVTEKAASCSDNGACRSREGDHLLAFAGMSSSSIKNATRAEIKESDGEGMNEDADMYSETKKDSPGSTPHNILEDPGEQKNSIVVISSLPAPKMYQLKESAEPDPNRRASTDSDENSIEQEADLLEDDICELFTSLRR